MNFYDKLYFGYYMYGRNYYGHDYSVSYGVILLQIAITVIIVLPLAFFATILHNNVSGISPKVVIIISYLMCVGLNIFYFTFRKRNRKIIAHFSKYNNQNIQRMKKVSGYFTLFAFAFFLVCFICLFINSTIKHSRDYDLQKQKKEQQLLKEKQDSIRIIN